MPVIGMGLAAGIKKLLEANGVSSEDVFRVELDISVDAIPTLVVHRYLNTLDLDINAQTKEIVICPQCRKPVNIKSQNNRDIKNANT
jgi:hypothetical protein